MIQTYDYVIIGSGFGGSVSAMRLAERGYSVLVLEKGSGTQFDPQIVGVFAAEYRRNQERLAG